MIRRALCALCRHHQRRDPNDPRLVSACWCNRYGPVIADPIPATTGPSLWVKKTERPTVGWSFDLGLSRGTLAKIADEAPSAADLAHGAEMMTDLLKSFGTGSPSSRPADPSFPVQKFSHVAPVSREEALLYGLVEPTLAEQIKREQDRIDMAALRAAATAAWPGLVADLDAVTDPVARAVLDLHHAGDEVECTGCEFDGWEAESPDWPCRTVITVAETLGIPVPPDLYLAEQHR